MAERRKSNGPKGNEGEEGTDGSKQKGGGVEKDRQQKRSSIGGAAHYVNKRVTGQPKSTPKKKSFDSPAPPPPQPFVVQETSQQHLKSTWPIPWQDTTQAPVPSGETLSSTEGATPPTIMRYDDDDEEDDNLTSIVPEAVAPQQSSDDVELSLKLARIELENTRFKKEMENKERQIREYEEEIIVLRTQMSRSGGGGGVQVVADQLTTQKLTHTIHQLEKEREELMKGKKEVEIERDKLAKKMECTELMWNVEIIEVHKEKERELAEAMEAVKREKKKNEVLKKELNDIEANEIEQLQLQKAIVDDLKGQLAQKEEDILLAQAETASERKGKKGWQEQLLKEKEEEREEKEKLQKQLEELKAEHEMKLREQKERHRSRKKELKSEVEGLTEAEILRQSEVPDIGSAKREAKLERELGIEKDHVTSLQERIVTMKEALQEERIKTKDKEKLHKQELERERAQAKVLSDDRANLERKHKQEVARLKEMWSNEVKLLDNEFFALKQLNSELKEEETDKIKEIKEEIQVLTAQVNAYSHEVDKQKRLVTQNQEKHKTEVNQLNKRLDNEIKQHDNELAKMRQQLDNVSADKEELLRVYHQEQAKLEDQIDKLKKANIVLKDKVVASRQAQTELSRLHGVERQLSSKQEEVISLQQILSGFQNAWESSHREMSLLEELGRGGYGVVWVGQLRVAVKKLHEWIVSQHNMETFHHEINIMSQLRHPNLLQFIGAVLDHPSGCPMIVTEVMDTSLRKAYENKELTPDPDCRPVILSIMHDAAQGLDYLHCLPDPIIHRDVSSANVLLRSIAGPRKWKGKISDFGSAKLAENAVTEGPGAFAYSAPEAFQNMANPDPTKKQTTKMDVFSYGILLCEIITCRFPNRDIFRGMLRQVHSISDRPSGTRDTQGSLLHSLIVSCCHDDPSRRPTMKEIIEQLDIISK